MDDAKIGQSCSFDSSQLDSPSILQNSSNIVAETEDEETAPASTSVNVSLPNGPSNSADGNVSSVLPDPSSSAAAVVLTPPQTTSSTADGVASSPQNSVPSTSNVSSAPAPAPSSSAAAAAVSTPSATPDEETAGPSVEPEKNRTQDQSINQLDMSKEQCEEQMRKCQQDINMAIIELDKLQSVS